MSKHNFKANPNPIDTEVFVPPAVRRAAEAADALQRQATGQPDPTLTGTDPELIKIVEPEPPKTPPNMTTRVGNEPPPETPRDEPKPDPETPRSEDDPSQSWEHRYKSMHGQAKRLQKQNSELVDRIANLESIIETLDRPGDAPSTTSQLPEMQNLVTAEERNQFGDEMLDVIGRRAMEQVAPVITSLQAEIERLKSSQQNTTVAVHRTARERMYDTMSQQMPDWREVNDNPEFTAWLALPNIYSGVTRMKELQAAFDQNNAARVLAFFNGFKSELAVSDPEPTSTPPAANQQAPAPRAPKVKLEDLAAPGRARATGAEAPDEKPIISTADITAFYKDVRKGVYLGRDEEKLRLEQMIFAAQREGRVR